MLGRGEVWQVRRVKVCCGEDWRGLVGQACLGEARIGEARRGTAVHGR